MQIVLHQFAFSHFNEKARWALAVKNVDYRRETYLPGPHMPAIKKLSGQTQTPVLQIDNEYIAGSSAIIDELERRIGNHLLYPHQEPEQSAALTYQASFDELLGPAVRTVLFDAMIAHGGYITRMFGQDKPWFKQTLYRATYPLAKPLIAKGNGVTIPGNVEKCRHSVHAELDKLAGAVVDTGYLVGEKFSVADLTAAAFLAPLAAVEHADMARPRPLPDSVALLLEEFSAHPTIAWVNGIYRNHRP